MISFTSLNIDTTEFISVVLLYILDPKQTFIQGFPNYHLMTKWLDLQLLWNIVDIYIACKKKEN